MHAMSFAAFVAKKGRDAISIYLSKARLSSDISVVLPGFLDCGTTDPSESSERYSKSWENRLDWSTGIRLSKNGFRGESANSMSIFRFNDSTYAEQLVEL